VIKIFKQTVIKKYIGLYNLYGMKDKKSIIESAWQGSGYSTAVFMAYHIITYAIERRCPQINYITVALAGAILSSVDNIADKIADRYLGR